MKNGDFADKNEYSIGLSWGYVFLQVFPEANSGRVGSSAPHSMRETPSAWTKKRGFMTLNFRFAEGHFRKLLIS